MGEMFALHIYELNLSGGGGDAGGVTARRGGSVTLWWVVSDTAGYF